MKKYIVELTTKERSQLDELSKNPKVSAQRRRRADILLAVDQGQDGPSMKDADMAKAFRCRVQTIERIRKACIGDGLESCLQHGNRGAHRVKTFDGVATLPSPSGFNLVRVSAENFVRTFRAKSFIRGANDSTFVPISHTHHAILSL